MSTLLINSDSSNTKLLLELAKKLGANVVSINDEQYEDLLLGNEMDKVKTNELISKEEIFKKFLSK
jgi:4-hydroxy-3-methylbut-2-enyl diphosphate reductase IspH